MQQHREPEAGEAHRAQGGDDADHAQRDHEVLDHDATRAVRESQCIREAREVVAHQDDVGGFHGDLRGVPADKNLLKAKVLVCHGAADTFVPQEQVDAFKKQMDSIGADYTFKAYPDAVHAFTNPNATAIGEKFGLNIKYNAAADTASWKEMQDFFGRIFK